MNIASLDDAGLRQLRRFFVQVRDHGTEDGASRAPKYLEAIDAELALRGDEPCHCECHNEPFFSMCPNGCGCRGDQT